MRLLAIGDIHGHRVSLQSLLKKVAPKRKDLLVFTGDYLSKGPDEVGVVNLLMKLDRKYRCVFLRGNHEQRFLEGMRSHGEISGRHRKFLEDRCQDFFETEDFIFVHGGIRSHKAPVDEGRKYLFWKRLAGAKAHASGRTVVCGHSAQRSGGIADLGHTICIDTAITKGKYLSCLEMNSMKFWQSDQDGEVRKGILRRRLVTLTGDQGDLRVSA